MAYVRVAEEEHDQEPIELPIEDDGTMLLSTLTGQFPGACGLKYRNQDTLTWRGLRLANERIQYPGGSIWIDSLYVVVYPKGSDNKRKGEENSGNPAGKTRRLDVKKNQDLVVLGLAWKTSEDEVKEYFQQFGDVVLVEIKYHRDTGKSKGFGFIRFAEAETGHTVMTKKHLIQGRMCEVKVPDSRPERRKLFVRCLSKEVTEQDFRDYFSQYCEITDVFIPSPHRGFAFVTFEDAEVAQELKDKDHTIKGHHVQLNDADPKGKNRAQWGDSYNEGSNYGMGGGGGFGRGEQGEYRQGRDFRQEDRGRGRGRGRYNESREQNPGNLGSQLPMALAAALNQAGWSMLLSQGMQGQGGGPGGPNSQNNSSQQSQGGGSNTDGLGGGYGAGQGSNMSWSQGGQGGQSSTSGDTSGGNYYGGQGKGGW